MSMAETTFILNHFYNIFDVDRRLTVTENKFPIIAKKNDNGLPEGMTNEEIAKLSPGTLWIILEDNGSEKVTKSLTALDENKNFVNPIPFKIELTNVNVEDDIKEIINQIDPIATSYKDIIKTILNELTRMNEVTLVTLQAANWIGDSAPYTQTVTVNGATERMEPILVSALNSDATVEAQKAYSKAFGIISSGSGTVGNGTVTFKVYKKPMINITVGLKGVPNVG